MSTTSDTAVMRWLLEGDSLVVAKLRAMRGEVLGVSAATQKANAASLDSAVASNTAARGWLQFGSAAKWTAGIFGVGVALGLVDVLHRATTFMTQQNVALKQTQAELLSTGAAAGWTAKQLQSLADAQSMKTGLSPIDIQGGENALLGFTNVRGNIFKQAVLDADNLAVAMHNTIPNAAKALGFALDNPATGFQRLQRMSVDLSTTQKAYIKQLVATGQTELAQQFILDQVNKKYGDSARLYGQTLPGELGKLNNAIDLLLSRGMQPLLSDAKVFVGLLTAATLVVARHTAILEPLKYVLEAIGILVGVWAAKLLILTIRQAANFLISEAEALAWFGISTAATLASAAITIFEGAQTALTATMAFTTEGLWAAATAALGFDVALLVIPAVIILVAAGLYLLYTRVGWFHHAVIVAWTWIKQNWPLLLGILLGPFVLLPILIIEHWGTVVDFVKSLPGVMASAGAHVWDWLLKGFDDVLNTIGDHYNSLLGYFSWIPGVDDAKLPHFGPGGAAGGASAIASTAVTKTAPVDTGGAAGTGTSGFFRGGGTSAPKKTEVHVYLDSKEIAARVSQKQSTDQARR